MRVKEFGVKRDVKFMRVISLMSFIGRMMKIVSSCLDCKGFCCKAITLNSNRKDIPPFFKRLSGLEALSVNPFLPIHSLLEISSTPINFYQCTLLGENGLCSNYDKRPYMCRHFPSEEDDDLLHFIFPCGWCSYREKQLILLDQEYETCSFQECLDFYSDPINSPWIAGGSLDSCYRFNQYYKKGGKFQQVIIDQVNDIFLWEVFEVYRAHFVFQFNQINIKLKTSRNAFNKAALLCYEFGVTPEVFWNIAKLFGSVNSLKGKLPFPTYIMGNSFREFLSERLDKIIKREQRR
jgi:Fe-S-cluster containining protein